MNAVNVITMGDQIGSAKFPTDELQEAKGSVASGAIGSSKAPLNTLLKHVSCQL